MNPKYQNYYILYRPIKNPDAPIIYKILYHFRFLKNIPKQGAMIAKIPLNSPFSKGEGFLLPLEKGGREGFKNIFSTS